MEHRHTPKEVFLRIQAQISYTCAVQREDSIPHEDVPAELGMYFSYELEGVDTPITFDDKSRSDKTLLQPMNIFYPVDVQRLPGLAGRGHR
jgi:hypothetical protein